MTTVPARYAVFGNPIHHSKSPILHKAFAEQTGESILYTAELVGIDAFSTAADQFFSSDGLGLNITVPFKIDAFHYADTLSERAQKAGAVNTLIKKENMIIGDNTDGAGFIEDVTHNLQWVLKNKNILILGAGGAVRGILDPLLQAEPKKVVIANRTVAKAQQLIDDTKITSSGLLSACHYDDVNEDFDIIINGTSASLHGDLPVLSDTVISTNSRCYDMMYGVKPTVFMQWATQCGARDVADGLGMLVCQGAESFYQWRGIKPETLSVINQLRLLL
jgi:shikimate dehydrogenase